jgi:hypothetical protein
MAGLIVGLGFFVQRLTGFGSALIATPFLVVFWDAHNAINLQLLYQLLFGVMLIGKTWRALFGARMLLFTLASMPMLVIGSYCLPDFSPVLIQTSLGFILILVMIQWLFAPNFRIPERFQRPAAVIFGLLTGLIHGVFGTGGPFLLAYYANVEKNPAKIRDGTIAFFAVANFARLPVAITTAQINQDVLMAAAFTLIPFIGFMALGKMLAHHVDLKIFRILTIVILAFALFSLFFFR